MICPLCGHEFEQSDIACGGCPMHTKCDIICCPNCHYQFTEQSKTVAWLTGVVRKLKDYGTKGN